MVFGVPAGQLPEGCEAAGSLEEDNDPAAETGAALDGQTFIVQEHEVDDPYPILDQVDELRHQQRWGGEVRIVDPETGGEKGQKLARFDLLPPAALRQVAEHYGTGAAKYEDRNWERGYKWGLSFGAMQRHAWAFWNGESLDPETKTHHLAAVVFHALTLMTYEDKGLGTDDRSTA